MIAHGANILAANIATAVFIIILLWAFWSLDDKDEKDQVSSEREGKGKESEVQG